MKYISAAGTNKIIRNALKVAFPQVKFSVKLTKGGSCHIVWTDGPTETQVNEVVGKYEGASFDPMIDLRTCNVGELNGEPVHFGINYIITDRDYTEAGNAAIMAIYAAQYGDYDHNDFANLIWKRNIQKETAI